MTMTWPNKSPEPTAVGAYHLSRRFQTCHVAVPPWLSFFVRPCVELTSRLCIGYAAAEFGVESIGSPEAAKLLTV